jgi:hypothetical protein
LGSGGRATGFREYPIVYYPIINIVFFSRNRESFSRFGKMKDWLLERERIKKGP